ncbi:MAG: MFS transporter [Cytophagales bacterium]|nr:MFS transporter [Cytophagales bacterium]
MTDSQPQPLAPMPQGERRLLYILGGIQLTHIVDFMIMMPIGPLLSRDLGVATHQFGLLVSSYTFAAAIAGLLCAMFIDHFERKRLLLTLYALFALATLACALAPNYTGLLIARAIAGAFGGVLGAMVSTVVGDQIPPERRGRAGGYIAASFSLATVAGVPLGLWLANHTPVLGWRAPFVFVALMSMLLGVTAYKWLHPKANLDQALQPDDLSKPEGIWLGAWRRIRDTLADPVHRWATLFICLIMFSAFSVIPFITIYATGTVKFPETLLPVMYLVGGTCTLLSSRWIGKLTDRIGKRKSFLIFAPLAVIPMLITTNLTQVPVWVYMLVSTSFFVLVSARMIPTMALMNGAADPKLRGTFMSLSASFQQAAMGLGAFVTGHIVSTTSAGVMTGYNYAGYIALTATLLALWVSKKVVQRG